MNSSTPSVSLFDAPLSRTVWFLDYDGSLCPHLEVWEERDYDPVEIHSTVLRLAEGAAGVFWNTGRRPESLSGVHPGFATIPGYFIHGSLKWHPQLKGKQAWVEQLGPSVPDDLLRQAQSLAEVERGLRFEIKPTSLRFTPSPGGSMADLHHLLGPIEASTPEGWFWFYGHRGAELLAQGFDKKTALTRELAVDPSLIPIAVGDDILDRPAIEGALHRGGFAVIVGEGCGWITEVPHQAHQLIFCEKPRDVLTLITSLIDP